MWVNLRIIWVNLGIIWVNLGIIWAVQGPHFLVPSFGAHRSEGEMVRVLRMSGFIGI